MVGIRTRLDELLEEKFGPLRERLVAGLPVGLAERLKNLLENPRALSGMIEEKSPWLSRQVLGAASNVAEPFIAGMGLQVVELGEDSTTVSMPGWWRNQGEGGAVHAGAICTLAEFAARIYWEYHLDLRRSEITLLRMQLRPVGVGSQSGLNQIRGSLRAQYHVPVSGREQILHDLRANGETSIEGEVAIYDEGQKLVAQLEVEWRFQRQLSLGPSRAGRSV